MRSPAIERRISELEKRKRSPGDTDVLPELLTSLDSAAISNPDLLARFHDALLFLSAHPPSVRLRKLAESLLKRLARRVAAMVKDSTLDPLLDPEIAGISGTSVEMVFSWESARWLADRFPRQIEIDWDIEVPEERLSAVVTQLIPFLEESAAADANVRCLDWMRATGAMTKDQGASFLIRNLEQLPLPSRQVAALYDSLGLALRWNLGESKLSRTRMRRKPRDVFHHRAALLSRREVSIEGEMAAAPLPVRKLSMHEGEAVLDMGRAAMATRYRELYAFTFGDPASCVSADAGRGLEIVLTGIAAEKRLPLRAGFGVLLFRNGVPIGYADAFGLCERMDVSFNIFHAFRDGESAFCLARMLKLYYQLFGSTSFFIDPYQIGLGNEEAIEAGAFWFYRKLGFDLTDPLAGTIVQREEERVARDPRYRTPSPTLRKIARSSLLYEMASMRRDTWSRFHVRRLGERIAKRFAAFDGPASSFSDESRERVTKKLGISLRALNPRERRALEQLAPLLDLIPGLEQWSRDERAGVKEIIRAKAGAREQDYLRLLSLHERLRAALLRLGST